MISIITPVLNGEKFIENNIVSVQSLTIPFEHIIVDGGSTDATLQILSKYPHLKVIHQTTKNGMYGAIHLGFEKALHNYITWINCDDIIYSKNFEYTVQKANDNNIDFIYGDAEFKWQNENKVTFQKANPFGKYFLKKGILPFVQPSSLYSRAIYNSIKFNYDQYKIIGDIDFFINIASNKEMKFWYCRKTLSQFLKYGNSLGDRNTDLYLKERKILNINPNFIDRVIYKLTLNL